MKRTKYNLNVSPILMRISRTTSSLANEDDAGGTVDGPPPYYRLYMQLNIDQHIDRK